MDSAGVHRHQVLEVGQRQYCVVGVDRRRACLEHTDEREQVVSHRAVTRWRHDHDFGAEFESELSCHLDTDEDLVPAGLRQPPAAEAGQQRADLLLAVRIDPEQQTGFGLVPRGEQATAVEARRSRGDVRIGLDARQERVQIDAVVSADRVMHVALRQILGGVHLHLPHHQARTVFDELGHHPVREPDHHDRSEVSEGEPRGRDPGAAAVTPEVSPSDPPPHRVAGHSGYRRARRVLRLKKLSSRSMSNSSSWYVIDVFSSGLSAGTMSMTVGTNRPPITL